MTCLESMYYDVAGKECDGIKWFMSRSEKNQYFKLVSNDYYQDFNQSGYYYQDDVKNVRLNSPLNIYD